ncbi:DUF3108 domain-containing protein [Ottowia thiooxydans]|uniref:DUF3108 domain-containing protein n=1 Tax=Ottowia thiooxydans TaxID=219182 RepID=A0ABV2QDQ5_9BURK
MATFVALALHVVALAWLTNLLQPPSVLKEVSEPFYTRTITPQPPEPPPTTTVSAPPPPKPSVRVASAKPGKVPTAKPPQTPASAPLQETAPDTLAAEPAEDKPTDLAAQEPAATPGETASAPALAQAPSNSASDPASQVAGTEGSPAPAPVPSASASDTPPAFLATWPANTRLRYSLGGNFRGELHGNAQVRWQREGTRYQAVVQLDLGILMSSRFTSQGEITERGLRPELYEEQVRSKRRGVRIGEDIRLDNGERVPRPEEIQDAASQFLELGHRFSTGQVQLKPGSQINFWLARPGGVDEWTYDVVGEDTVQLPGLGPTPAFHLKPRPLAKPRSSVSAEIWFAPSLQYLPVRIRLTSGPDTYVDLMVETVEQN